MKSNFFLCMKYLKEHSHKWTRILEGGSKIPNISFHCRKRNPQNPANRDNLKDETSKGSWVLQHGWWESLKCNFMLIASEIWSFYSCGSWKTSIGTVFHNWDWSLSSRNTMTWTLRTILITQLQTQRNSKNLLPGISSLFSQF